MRALRVLFLTLLLLATALLAHDLLVPPVYRFPPAEPFSGPRWYNPYASLPGPWLRCVTHAHAVSAAGIADRDQDVEKVCEVYESLGYDVVAVTAYQRIHDPSTTGMVHVPGYEHGIGPSQQHHSVLGARSVSWFDYFLFHGLRGRQHVIDRLREDSKALIINHPDKGIGYSIEDMRRLTGVTAVEVESRFADGAAHWDAALSAGRPIWGVCSDDGHQYQKRTDTGRGWIRVSARDRSREGFFEGFNAGRFYGVWRDRNQREPNDLAYARIEDGRYRVAFSRPASRILFIGQGGERRHLVRDAARAEYSLRPDDTYVRVVAVNRGETSEDRTVTYLNPVFRHDGEPLKAKPAVVLQGATLAVRLGGGALLVLLAVGLVKLRRRHADLAASAPPRGTDSDESSVPAARAAPGSSPG